MIGKQKKKKHGTPVFLVLVLTVFSLVGYKYVVRMEMFLPEYEKVFYTAEGESTEKTGQTIAEALRFSPKYVNNVLGGMGATVVKEEYVNDIHIIYAYSPLVFGSQQLSFGRVNIMIAVSHVATAASPLIYGSY